MTQFPSLPELPIGEIDVYFNGQRTAPAFTADQMNAHGRACYEAGRASRAQSEPLTWFDGEPPFPQNQELFIAETTYGDRVVLMALPKEHSYDYKTADQTYMKAALIKRWMQFPNCEYLAPLAPTQGAEGAAPQAVAAEIRDLLCELGNGVKSSNWRLAERAFDMSAKFLVDQPLAATADPATHDDSDDIAAEKAAQGYPGAES